VRSGAGKFAQELMGVHVPTVCQPMFRSPLSNVELFIKVLEKDAGWENQLRLVQKNLKKRNDSRGFNAGDEAPAGLGSPTAVSREWLCCLHRREAPTSPRSLPRPARLFPVADRDVSAQFVNSQLVHSSARRYRAVT